MADRRYAALTMVRDEDIHLKIWHRYYATEFGAENCFVIDHNSQEKPPQSVVPEITNVFRIPFDNPINDLEGISNKFDNQRFNLISKYIAGLLHYYDCVIFNDADEVFITNHPEKYGLREYLNSLDDIGIRAGIGVEIFHDIINEAPYDFSKPLFEQRKNYRYYTHFCKPWILTKPIQITGHGAYSPIWLDPNLIFLHLHYFDGEGLLTRRENRNQAFQEGRGGHKSRWRMKPIDALRELQRFSERSVTAVGMPHQELFEPLIPGFTDKQVSNENYEGSNRRRDLVQLNNYIPREESESIRSKRYQFPPRFKLANL